MKILFVSTSPTQTIVTVSLGYDVSGYEVHLYNRDNGYTEKWTSCNTYEDAAYYHKQLCNKCYITVNM